MSHLHLKLLRDVRAALWQFLAISLVASLGVAMFHGMLVAYLNQKASYQVSYQRLGFADVWVAMEGAPRSVVRAIARLPGVRAVEGRLVAEVEVEQERGRRPRVMGRLVTLPSGPDAVGTVNRLRLLEGRPLANPPRREVLLEASFARAHSYRPGDRLYPKFNGERVSFVVAGIVASPEYIYPVQSKQFLVPTPETFGVLFAPQREVEALLGKAGSINEVVLLTEEGRALAVGQAVARRLRSYGPQAPMTQAEQPSNQLLQSDLEGYKPILVVMPTLFLGVAGLAVALVLARWVQAQRGQIGFLRASGFSARAILCHYLEVGLVAGVGGGILGVALGYWLGGFISGMYERLLHMPYFVRESYPEVAAIAFGLSLAACLLGAAGPARQAARIPPAEAMRGQMPTRPSRLAQVRLPLALALPLRNVLRRPLRTLGTAAGVLSAVMLLVVSGSLIDSMDEGMELYLREIQRYDLSVGFLPPRSQTVLYHLARWPGVLHAEPSLEIPVRVGHDGFEKETVAVGVVPGSRLRHLVGPGGRPLVPLPGTILFSDTLAKRLRVEVGDVLRLAYIQNTRYRNADADLPAGHPVRQPIGFPVYMRLDELQHRFAARLGMPPDAIAGALLEVDPRYLVGIRDRLHRLDGVALVQTKGELERQIGELTAFSRTFLWVMFLFASAMAFVVVYTATDTALWERTRELATLRTLGFGMRRIGWLVSLENLLVAGVGALAGLYPGQWLARLLIQASQTEGFSMQAVVAPRSYLLALAGPLLMVFLAQWPGLRRISRLDLAAAIRLREE
ncbi:MAG: ABC transporter permease [Armatimonadetes bacterium]|nr:ABC transporter permease [Armatimonadota bacterium]